MATKQFEKIADKLAKKTIQQERGRCIDELGNKIPDILTEETCVDVINSFEYADKCGQSYRRSKEEESLKKDTSVPKWTPLV